MASTFICSKCKELFRISSEIDLTLSISEHKLKCNGEIISIWKDYDKMNNQEKEKIINQIMFKYGKLGKLK